MADTLIIIPAYNEEACIARTLAGLLAERLDADILVINDGSADRTGAIVQAMPVYLIQHPVNLGYGAALQSGYKFALSNGYRYVVQFDADGQHHTSDLIGLLAEIRKNDADVVIGSRFLGNPRLDLGRKKTAAIKAFRFLIRMLTQREVTDPTSGLRGLNVSMFGFYSERGQFPTDFPDADIIIDMLLRRYRLREFPIGSREREAGVSMHSGIRPLIYMLKVMISIIAVWLKYTLNGRRDVNAQP